MTKIKLTWKCTLCNDVVVSDSSLRHDMNFCKCGETGVDLEEHYMRGYGLNMEEISRETVEMKDPIKKKGSPWYEDGINKAREQLNRDIERIEDIIWGNSPPHGYEGLIPPQEDTKE
jgi:hypothetical protein